MTAVVATSELEAVNVMLDCINESPVSSLALTGLLDLTRAKATLDEVSREVQERGWHFNTEYDVTLTPSGPPGPITLATDIVRVDAAPAYASRYDVVQRGTSLYWRNENTVTFTEAIDVDLIRLLPWDSLPQAARHYIMIRAARRFQARQLGSDTKYKFSEEEEAMAHASLQASESANNDVNMLSGSWSVAQILER